MSGMIADTDKIHCSFCDQSVKDVRKIIAGRGDIYICCECVIFCMDTFADQIGKDWEDDVREDMSVKIAKQFAALGSVQDEKDRWRIEEYRKELVRKGYLSEE